MPQDVTLDIGQPCFKKMFLEHPAMISKNRDHNRIHYSAPLLIALAPQKAAQMRKLCERCLAPLPYDNYRLRFCPRCRKETIDAYLDN